ncbi:MAG: phosphoenolpyruvate synthase [Gemmatimonas sp.]|nr:phosphoenolpyruvate synthase [Gemmatimonas sp.]
MPIPRRDPLVLPLGAPEAPLDRVGGKAASLAALATAGLPVPTGFDLTTAAYRRFVAENDLAAAILDATSVADKSDPGSLDRAAATIHALFEGGGMPPDIATAIREAYAGLGEDDPAVAVRSSATAEDLPDLSFAGQQDTYLNMRGEAALLDAVQRCWASLWTARAIGYRLRMGIDQHTVAMGVVVQVLVPAEVSGVLFTANPTTGDRSELVVNASFGLGEAIVSGQVTPDTYTVDRASLATKAVTLGAKEAMIVASDGQGTTTAAVAEARRGERALSDPLLRELATLALCVEQQFGVPQDVEWAVANGRLWLLQCRPITSLLPAPLPDVRWEPAEPGTQWVRRQVVENMPEPLSPLFDELYLREGLDRSSDAMQDAMGVPRRVRKVIDRPLFATVNGYAYMRASLNLRWWTVPLVVGAMLTGVPAMFRKGISYWRDDGLPAYLATVRHWKQLDATRASDELLLRGVRELAWADATYWFAATLAIGAAKVADDVFSRFLSIAAPGRNLSSGLYLRGFPSKTLEAQAELEAIAGRTGESEALQALMAATPAHRLREALASISEGRATLEALQQYLDRFGHQIYTLDFAEPTQADEPLPVLLSLKALSRDLGRSIRDRQDDLAREREQLVEQTARSFDPLRRKLFRSLLALAQRFGPNREEALFYVGAAWPTLRRLATVLGQRLADAGSLASADDVFYLKSTELAEASAARTDGRALPHLARLASERRALRQARKRLHPPAAVPPTMRWKLGPIDLSGRETQRRNTSDAMTLRGFAVSPGRVTAPASVILSPADFSNMEPGTILVCPTTTPAWTPLFAQARGLVTDIGGVLAHGSIVAREYGIPAVMGTGSATQRVAQGQQLTVDGDAGTVTVAT